MSNKDNYVIKAIKHNGKYGQKGTLKEGISDRVGKVVRLYGNISDNTEVTIGQSVTLISKIDEDSDWVMHTSNLVDITETATGIELITENSIYELDKVD